MSTDTPKLPFHSLCVFCGSSKGFHPVQSEVARHIGAVLAERNIRLVYGAGNVGLMGVMADAVLENGGQVLGIIPEFLKEKEVCHTELTELIVTETMHQRKEVMAKVSDGFIVLPGGYGTLDEFFEILTWRQLQLHNKPIGLLNVNGYYDHLIEHVRQMWLDGFLREVNLSLFAHSTDFGELLEKMTDPVDNNVGKWV